MAAWIDYMMRLSRRIAAPLALAWALGVSSAWAALNDPLARDLKAQGDQSMEQGRYEQALESYERATAIEAHPSLLYNRARAMSALERHVEALRLYEAFRDQAPDDLRALVPQLDGLITATNAKVSEVSFELPDREARVYVRGREVVEPRSLDLRFLAGPAVVRVVVEGYEPFEKSYELPGGGAFRIEPKLRRLDQTGLLRVTSPIPGAEVFIDGERAGMAPVEVPVPIGPHDIALRHPKYRATTTRAVVQRAQTTRLDVDMDRKPTLLKRWWFWASLATVAAGGAALGVALTTERSPDSGSIPPGTVTIPVD